MKYRYLDTTYLIEVTHRGEKKILLDNKKINNMISLVDDKKEHKVEIFY